MLILRPFKSSLLSKEDVGPIEEVVRETRLVDKGIEELTRFSRNAPSFEPERRRFLKHVAVLAGLYASGQLLKGCSTIQEPVQFQGKTYSNWEAYLLTQDLVRGPRVLKHPRDGLPSESEHHRKRTGWNAVDFDVPIGTPIVPIINAFRTINSEDNVRGRTGGIWLDLYHRYGSGGYKSSYAHLNGIAKLIQKGESYVSPRDQMTYRNQLLNMLKIVAFSGNSGVGPGGGYQPEHLELQIKKIVDGQFEVPGIDPFQAGIDAKKPFGGVDDYGIPYGGRPIYYDGKTIVYAGYENLQENNKFLRRTLDTLEARVKESDLDNATKDKLLNLRSNPEKLRDYLAMRVLLKKGGSDGMAHYEFSPDSLMYALNIELLNRMADTYHEFPAFLPFIFPTLKPVYQKANPDVKF